MSQSPVIHQDRETGLDLHRKPEPLLVISILKSCGRFIKRYPLGAVGGVTIVVLVLMAIFPQLFTPLDTQSSDYVIGVHISDRFLSPNSTAWFGTNGLGRDMYARLIYGARTAIMIGFGAVLLGKTLSTTLGIASAFLGGWTDAILQRFVEVFQSIPTILFLIIAVVAFESKIPSCNSFIPSFVFRCPNAPYAQVLTNPLLSFVNFMISRIDSFSFLFANTKVTYARMFLLSFFNP